MPQKYGRGWTKVGIPSQPSISESVVAEIPDILLSIRLHDARLVCDEAAHCAILSSREGLAKRLRKAMHVFDDMQKEINGTSKQ